jgi:NAD(P)-dependent dehydrogenase (short-subunit alcohol dehydrogenase family)
MTGMRLPDLSDKVVLITGAGAGIGAATSLLLAQTGAQVIAAVKPGTGSELDAENKGAGARITVTECDVSSDRDIDRLYELTSAKFGRLDVLINNAGRIMPIGRIEAARPEEWEACLAVNAGGAFRCTRRFLAMLLAVKGLVINLSSGAAYRPLEGWSAYCASKAALVMLSRSIAHEYGEQGLRVFSFGVAPTDTEMQAAIRNSGINPVSLIPRGQLMKPERVAAVLAWLCGPDSRLIQEIEIDIRNPLFAYLLAQGDAV